MLQATINLLHNKLVYEKLIKLTSSLKRDENFKTFCIKDALKKFLNKRGNSAFQTGIFFPLMVFLCAKFTVHTAELNLKKSCASVLSFLIFEKSNGFHLFFNFHRLEYGAKYVTKTVSPIKMILTPTKIKHYHLQVEPNPKKIVQ